MNATSKYKYVQRNPNGRAGTKSGIERSNKTPWLARFGVWDKLSQSQTWRSKCFATEREAALQVDKWLIELGKPPVNILKPRP
jgi:hypothetical protein